MEEKEEGGTACMHTFAPKFFNLSVLLSDCFTTLLLIPLLPFKWKVKDAVHDAKIEMFPIK